MTSQLFPAQLPAVSAGDSNIVIADIGGNVTIATHTGKLKVTPDVTVYDDSIIPQNATNVVIAGTGDLTAIHINTSALQLLQIGGPIANLTDFTLSPIAAENAPLGTVTISNANLTQASVDLIIEACVAGGAVDGTLTLSGGTSAAPSAGAAENLATLTTRTWTVSTN